MNFPSELKYTKDHEWIKVEGDQATIGITEFAQDQLGDIVYVEVKTVGQEVKAHDIFGTIEAVKTVSDLFMPVTGSVVEFNPLLDSQPELVNTDPYGDGWIIKISVSDASSLEALLSHDAYAEVTGH